MKFRQFVAMLLTWVSTQAHPAAPATVMDLERQLADHPVQVLVQAKLALSAARDDSARLDAMVRAVVAAGTLERLSDLAEQLPGAKRLSEKLGSSDVWCQLATEELTLRNRESGIETALALADQAQSHARSLGLDWCVARLEQARGRLLQNDGRLADSAAALLSALRYYETHDDALRAAATLNELAWLAHREKADDGSRLAIERGTAALARLPTPMPRYVTATVHHNLAAPFLSVGDLKAARTHLDLSLQLAMEIDDELGSAYIARLLALLELREKHPKAALAWIEKAQPIFTQAGLLEMQHVSATLRADALLQLKRHQEALDALAAAELLRKRVDTADADTFHWKTALRVHSELGHSAATAAAAEAYARALHRGVRESRQRVLAETNARFQTERREAENRLLREQQKGAAARQSWLLVSLTLLVLLLFALFWHVLLQRRVRQRLNTLALVDELTQLPNRRAAMDSLRQYANMARRHGSCLAVALCDIDHFKRVNDRFGHGVGDEALRCFARVGRQVIRGSDVLGRVGGEEFLLILPAATVADAQRLFDRLLGALSAASVAGMPAGEHLSFSMGVAVWRPEVCEEELLKEADEALYRAKSAGRARMESALPMTEAAIARDASGVHGVRRR